MLNTLRTAITLVVFTTLGSTALADAGHHDDEKSKDAAQTSNDMNTGKSGMGEMGMMGGSHHEGMADMMGMMMQMHAGMNMGMKSGNMMELMQGVTMEGFDADSDGDGTVTGEEAHGMLQSMHAKSDTNDDGSLSISEFEVLHNKMVRMQMVDRFQNLDEDGDGMVTIGEMTAPADQMGMSMKGHGQMGETSGSADN